MNAALFPWSETMVSSPAGSGLAAVRQQHGSKFAHGVHSEAFTPIDSEVVMETPAECRADLSTRTCAVTLAGGQLEEACRTYPAMIQLIRRLFPMAVQVHVRELYWSGAEDVSLLCAEAADRQGDREDPCVIMLWSSSEAADDEIGRLVAAFPSLHGQLPWLSLIARADSGPAAFPGLAPPLELVACLCKLRGGCWLLPNHTLDGDRTLCSYSSLARAYDASGEHRKARRAGEGWVVDRALSVIDELWQDGGALSQLASLHARERVDLSDFIASYLSRMAYELSQQLLPARKVPTVTPNIDPPLLDELTRLTELAQVVGPDGTPIRWGGVPEYVAESPLAMLAAADEQCGSLVELLAFLRAAAGTDALSDSPADAASLAWASKWRPCIAACHGDLHAGRLLVDGEGTAWLGGGLGGGHRGARIGGFGRRDGASGGARLWAASVFEDAARLAVSLLIEHPPSGADEVHIRQAIDALLPQERAAWTRAAEMLWVPRQIPPGASPITRRLLALCSHLLRRAVQHAARVCGPRESANDLHPLSWHLPLLVHALALLRSPTLGGDRKGLAWYLALRCARATISHASRPPNGLSPAGHHRDGLMATTGVRLARCQALAIRSDLARGHVNAERTLAFASAHGEIRSSRGVKLNGSLLHSCALLTSPSTPCPPTPFSRASYHCAPRTLCAHRCAFDKLDGAHHRAHASTASFEHIREYDDALKAIARRYAHWKPRFQVSHSATPSTVRPPHAFRHPALLSLGSRSPASCVRSRFSSRPPSHLTLARRLRALQILDPKATELAPLLLPTVPWSKAEQQLAALCGEMLGEICEHAGRTVLPPHLFTYTSPLPSRPLRPS